MLQGRRKNEGDPSAAAGSLDTTAQLQPCLKSTMHNDTAAASNPDAIQVYANHTYGGFNTYNSASQW
jgi:hypothetical protein